MVWSRAPRQISFCSRTWRVTVFQQHSYVENKARYKGAILFFTKSTEIYYYYYYYFLSSTIILVGSPVYVRRIPSYSIGIAIKSIFSPFVVYSIYLVVAVYYRYSIYPLFPVQYFLVVSSSFQYLLFLIF
jgi:hypothetical protein